MIDFAADIEAYRSDTGAAPRYRSFDYCYNYFQAFRDRNETRLLGTKANLQMSCLQLGFYLASWGMLRGSSPLLDRSVRHYARVVSTLAELPAPIWDIDVDTYSDANRAALMDTAAMIRKSLQWPATGALATKTRRPSDTLVTKVMLGVLGSVPAFDTNFRAGLNVSTLTYASLGNVGDFYRNHSEAIELERAFTVYFDTDSPTPRRYPRGKVIDMVLFEEGARLLRKRAASTFRAARG